jgi:hypothetical protein
MVLVFLHHGKLFGGRYLYHDILRILSSGKIPKISHHNLNHHGSEPNLNTI